MEILLQTDKSFIGVYKNVICNEELHKCVLEIQDKLLDYPKIRIYNNDAIQHRCIGFFSDKSIGYYYSGQLAKAQPLSENIKKIIRKY